MKNKFTRNSKHTKEEWEDDFKARWEEINKILGHLHNLLRFELPVILSAIIKGPAGVPTAFESAQEVKAMASYFKEKEAELKRVKSLIERHAHHLVSKVPIWVDLVYKAQTIAHKHSRILRGLWGKSDEQLANFLFSREILAKEFRMPQDGARIEVKGTLKELFEEISFFIDLLSDCDNKRNELRSRVKDLAEMIKAVAKAYPIEEEWVKKPIKSLDCVPKLESGFADRPTINLLVELQSRVEENGGVNFRAFGD